MSLVSKNNYVEELGETLRKYQISGKIMSIDSELFKT